MIRTSLFLLLSLTSFLYATERPNIIVIITDDQGWGDIGYNNPAVYTPNLDRLSSQGARFENHYVMPQCTPTRVAAFTGRYPSRFGGAALQASNAQCFPLGTPTLASALKSLGYRTYLAGKWHMGSDPKFGPQHFGFDHSYGSLAGAVGMYHHLYRPQSPYAETWHRDHELIPGHEDGVHVTDLIAQEAVEIIEKTPDEPLFLMVTFHAPHTPLDERGSFVDQPTQLDPDRPDRWLNEDNIEWFNDPEGKIQAESDPEKRLFLAAVHHVDHAIGQITQALEKTGQKENTLILFSSDNGPQVSWPGNAYPHDLKLTDFNQAIPMRGHKCDVWEGGIHVPGFAYWPGRIQPRTIKDQVHIIDWFPTIANLTGAPAPENLDGTDLSPALFNDQTIKREELYWIWKNQPSKWALRHGDWKVVHYSTTEPTQLSDWELFDLKNDPKETRDLSTEKPAILADLHNRFLAQRDKDKTQSK